MSAALKNKLPAQVRNSLMANDFTHLRRNSSNPLNRNSVRKNRSNKPEFSEGVKKLARKMLFRVKLYLMMNKAKKQVKTHLDLVNPAYNRLIRVLQNQFRSNANAEFVLEYLKQLSFFANFIRDLGEVSETAVTELCKCVRYEYLPAGNIVFKEGDPSNDKFYVILKGNVTVVKRHDGNVFVQQNRKLQKQLTKAPQLVKPNLDHLERHSDDESKSSDESESESSEEELDPESQQGQLKITELVESLGNKLSEMKEGEGFGEKALLAKCGKRTASIVTNTNCDFLVMMKKDYMEIITKYDKRRQAKMKFMTKHIPYLDSIVSTEIIENLFYLIKEVDHSKGAVIAQEGAPGKHLFFIQDGYCDIEKTIISESGTGKNTATYKIKRKLATFGPGSCLGEEVLLSMGPKYDYTITASSSTVKLYSVDKFAFISRFPRESTAAIIEAYNSKEVVHKEKIKKIAENLGNLTGQSVEQVVKPDGFGQLMHSSLRNSVFSHLRMASNRSKGQQSPSSQIFDSPRLKSRDLGDSPQLSTRELKLPNDHLFARALRPIPVIERGFRGGSESIEADPSESQTSQPEEKLLLTDEINQSSSPRARLKGVSHSMVPTSPGSAAHNKRLEILIPERRRSSRKLQAITNYDTPNEKKSTGVGVINPDRLLIDKFDFGSPMTTAKSVTKRFSIRQEKKSSGEISPQKTQYGAFEAYYSHGSESAKAVKETKATPRTTTSGSSFKIKTSTPRDIAWSRPSNLLQDKKIGSARLPATEERELKTWSVEELDSKFMGQVGKVRAVMVGISSKTDLEVSKKSIGEIIRNVKELKKSTSQRSLKDKKRINDCLSQKKSREKFNIRMMRTFGRDMSPQSKDNESLSLLLH